MTLVTPVVEEHLAGVDAAVDRMAVWARSAGPDAPVPTCPGWTVRDLLAHQGMVHRWASGQRLDAVLRGQDMAAGDFVRRCKQIVDLLGQLAEAALLGPRRRTAKKAVDLVLRGVVAADRLD
jgi:hypothetical protein